MTAFERTLKWHLVGDAENARPENDGQAAVPARHKQQPGIHSAGFLTRYDTIRYEMLLYVRSKANMSQLNLPHGTDN